MTRLLHTGDTHLGYQQYHVPERREDFLSAFRQVVADAVEMDVDAVVHAGDLFHDRRPTLPDILGTIDVLRDLDAADVPFLAIVGNHEAKRDAQWLDLFESLGLATRLGDEPVVVGDTAVYGLDFVPRSRRDDLAYEFTDHDAEHAALVAHGLFEPFDLGEWDAREIVEGATVDFDALLLGDNHDPGTKRVADTWLTYCGSTERASADEREDRGYNLVTFEDDVTISRRGIETREFVFVEMDLADHEGVEAVHQRVGQHDLEDAVVIVHVDGEGEPLAPASVEEYAREEGALVARVTDHRETSDDGEVSVSFADPDDAVRERVRELGLSQAARDLDETIRASKVPDSTVADTVQSRVDDLLEEDPSAFDSAPPTPESSAETVADDAASVEGAAADDESSATADATSEDDDGGSSENEIAEPTEDDPEPTEDDAEPTGDDPEPTEDDAEPTGDDAEPIDGATASSTEHTGDGDDQASMEDYL